jgi:hypothetical protein
VTAANLGLSRNEYLRRKFEEGITTPIPRAGGRCRGLATIRGGLRRPDRPYGDGRRVAVTTWLIDKSAYARLQFGQAANRDEWSARISRGRVRLSTITRLELGYSARSGDTGASSSRCPHCR